MLAHNKTLTILGLVATLGLVGCSTTGENSTASAGAVAGSNVLGSNSGLERCAVPLGTLVIDDDREKDWYEDFRKRTNVTTIEPLIRLTVMQSNCFVITAAGIGKTADKIGRINQMQRHGEDYREDSNLAAGQRVASDYFLESGIILGHETVSNVSTKAKKKGFFGFGGSVDAGIETKVSVVTMSLFDIRTGIQLSMSEGNSSTKNVSSGLKILGSGASGSLQTYSRTPEGIATVAAFVDSFNKMVIALRSYKAQELSGGIGRGGQLGSNSTTAANEPPAKTGIFQKLFSQ